MLPVTVATFVKLVDAAVPLATDAVYVSATVVPVGTAPTSQLIRVPDAQVGPSAGPAGHARRQGAVRAERQAGGEAVDHDGVVGVGTERIRR